MRFEQLLFEAEKKQDKKEIKRLKRVIQRLDEQRITYGKIQRG